MSTAIPYQFTTTASTNLQPVRAGQTANFKSLVYVCTAAYNCFIKLYATGPNNTPPVVGTSVPFLTVQANTVAGGYLSFENGVATNGQLWVAVTKNAPYTDTTATAAGDVIVTLNVE